MKASFRKLNVLDIREQQDAFHIKHECKLTTQTVPILHLAVDSGICINLRRCIQSWCLISADHPLTARVFKSSYAIREEEVRCLARNVLIIHPFSMFALYWEFFMFFVYSALLAKTIVAAICEDDIADISLGKYWMISAVLNIIFVIDIIIMFFTGYTKKNSSKTVLEHSKIAKHYLSKWFWFDLLPMTYSSYSLIVAVFYVKEIFWLVIITRLCTYLRLFRLGRMTASLSLFCIYRNVSTFCVSLLKLIIENLILWSSIFMLLFLLRGNLDRYLSTDSLFWNSYKDDYFMQIYFLFLQMFHVDSLCSKYSIKTKQRFLLKSDIEEENLDLRNTERVPIPPSDIIYSIIIMIVGYCLQLLLFIQLYKLYVRFSYDDDKTLRNQCAHFVKYKGLPSQMSIKFLEYFDYKFQNRLYNETRISQIVPRLLKQEILVSLTQNQMKKVEFFNDIPNTVMWQLVARLKRTIYVPNQIIIKAGVAGDCMYFIYYGTVSIYSPNGREICHLDDGAHFGEIALLFNEPRTATVIAVTPCDIFILHRNDFWAVLSAYPKLGQKIYELSLMRLKTVSSNKFV